MRLSESLKYDLNKIPGSFSVRMLAGALITIAQIRYGVFWPSYFTILALVTLPAPIIFIVALIKPQLWRNKPIRYYLSGSAIASLLAVFCWVFWRFALSH